MFCLSENPPICDNKLLYSTMTKKGKQNICGYFLFMQEQREAVPNWANKSNFELQKLCDPLWRELSKEEKDTYKEMKKAKKEILNLRKEIVHSSSIMSRNFLSSAVVEDFGGAMPVKCGRKVA